MDQNPPRLTTAAACRVARLKRDQFNEAVASGFLECAPPTVAGRTRYFEPDDMIAVWLYRELTEDGYSRERAGRVACAICTEARRNPTAKAIAYVETYVGSRLACLPEAVPPADQWDQVVFSGSDIRRVTTFNVHKMRALIARETGEERRTVGEED